MEIASMWAAVLFYTIILSLKFGVISPKKIQEYKNRRLSLSEIMEDSNNDWYKQTDKIILLELKRALIRN